MKPKASFVFVALFVSLTSVQAADTWLGTTSASWNVDTNWQDSTKPVSEDLVTFDANSAANLSTILDGVFNVPGLVVTSPTAAVTIANGTGGSLAIGASGIDMSAATANLTFSFTANSLVSFSADQTFNIAASRTLTFSGTANNRTFALGSRVITKTGTGTLAINPGVSLASGTFDLQAGNTTIAAGNNISTTTASTVSYKVGTGATLSPIYNSGTLTFASPIELAGGTLATSGGSSHTFSGAISGSGGIISATQSSTGTVNNTFSGGFTGSGTFDLRCQNYSSNNHAFILSGNNSNFTGTFNINAASGTKVVRITNANGGSSSANWNVLAANNLQVSNVSVSLGNLNVYSGSTASFLAGSTVAFPTGKTVLIDAQATTTATNLTVAGTVNSAASVTIGRYGVMNVNSGATWNQSGDFYIAGTGGYGASVSVNTGGTFNYTGANTFKMNTAPSNSSYFTVNGGTFTTTNALQSSVGGSSSAYNGIFVLQNSGTFRLMADVTDLTAEPSGTGRKNLFQLGTGGGTIDTNGFSAALSQNITGAGALIKAGGGTLTLSGTNNYSGDTTLNGGVLTLSTATLANASKVTISTGTTLNLTHSATDTIDKLFIDGVQQVAGEWGATDSGAAHTSPSITGSGRLNVVTGPPGYASWSIVKGLTEANNAKDFDADNDGMNNLEEYAFDGEPLSGAANKKVFMKPGVGGGTLTIPVRKNAGPFTVVADGLMSPMIDGVIYHIQGSIDLVDWNEGITEVAADTSGPTLSDPTGWEYRTFQIPVGHEKAFLRVKITDTP